jgi:hypothetical protein
MSDLYAIFLNMAKYGIIWQRRKSAEELRRIQELRRSNAATFVPSKLQYKRKPKHVKRGYENESDTN